MKNTIWKTIDFWILITFIICSILIAFLCCSESKCWKAFVLISTISVTAIGAIYQAIKIESASQTISETVKITTNNIQQNKFNSFYVFELTDPTSLAVLLFAEIKNLVFPLLNLARKHCFKIMKDDEHLIKCVFMPFEKGGPNAGYEQIRYPLEKFEKSIKEKCGDDVDLTCVFEVLERMKYLKKENDYWVLDEVGEFNIISMRQQELSMQKLIEITMEKHK